MIGDDADNVIRVGSGANHVKANGGNDLIVGGAHDVETYTLPEVALASSFLRFPDFNVEIDTGSEFEKLYGGRGADTLYGSGQMFGGNGRDMLVSTRYGETEVSMTGGRGADEFVFRGDLRTSIPGFEYSVISMRGRILDFNPDEGDRIVLQDTFETIDDAALTWVGQFEELGYNEIGYRSENQNTVLYYMNKHVGYSMGWEEQSLRVVLEGYDGELGETDILIA